MYKLFPFSIKSILSFIIIGLVSAPAFAITKNLENFKAINAKGAFTIILKQDVQKQPNSISAPKNIASRITKHVLFIRQTRPSRKPITIVVHLHKLRQLDVFNNVSVKGSLRSKRLMINTHSRGRIILNGMIALRALNAAARSSVTIRWVNSHRVDVYGQDNSKIILSGRCDELVATLQNRSKLNAQYLRARKVMVQTKNHASAKVLPVRSLRAFAANNSNIYYYKRPKYITQRTTQSGNVLQVAWQN